LYDFNANQSLIRVLEGKATVHEGDSKVTLKKGHEVAFASAEPLKAHRFDRNAVEATSLYRWSELRSKYEAQANVSAAQNVVVYGGWYGPGWYWAPFWNCYTFLPGGGFLYSPFGWGLYSPVWLSRVWVGGYRYGYAPRLGHSPRFSVRPEFHPIEPRASAHFAIRGFEGARVGRG
jgi:hypothetical protein